MRARVFLALVLACLRRLASPCQSNKFEKFIEQENEAASVSKFVRLSARGSLLSEESSVICIHIHQICMYAYRYLTLSSPGVCFLTSCTRRIASGKLGRGGAACWIDETSVSFEVLKSSYRLLKFTMLMHFFKNNGFYV